MEKMSDLRNSSENRPAGGYITLILDRKDCDVLRHALMRYEESLQAHIDLLGGNGYITAEKSRTGVMLEEIAKSIMNYGSK